MAGKAQPIETRLKKHVVIDPVTGCHVWQKALNHHGYGVVNHGGRTRRAHRVAYELVHGQIQEGAQLDHLCHNADSACLGGAECRHRRCINVEHLEPVTGAVNQQRGLTAKLSRQQVDRIRQLRNSRKVKLTDLAEMFGISERQVSDITRGLAWRQSEG